MRGTESTPPTSQALQTSKEEILESISDAFYSLDRDWRFTYVNRRAAELWGVRIEDLLGKRIWDIFPDGRQTESHRQMCQAMEEGRQLEYESHSQRLNQWLSVSLYPTRQGLSVFFRDISERKRIEQALRDSERRFSLIHERSPFAIALTHMPDGITVSVNDAFLQLFGFQREQVLGKTSVDLGIADETSRASLAAQLRERGSVRGVEVKRRTSTGEERFIVVNLDSLEIAGESFVLTTIQDITERKRQEQRVEKLSRLYSVLSNVNEAIVRVRQPSELYRDVCAILAEDGERPLVWIALVKGRLLVPVAASGPEVDYMRGLRLELDGDYSRGPSGTCVREGRPVVNDDFDVNPATKPWRQAALKHDLRASAAFPIRQHNAVVGVLTLYAREPGTFDEEQVRLLAALSADISYALEKMGQDEALRLSERSLREADQRKNEFLAVLSHELRNPLTLIRNGLTLLESLEPASDRVRQARVVIHRQIDQMARLVDDLLDITRITRGKIRIRCAPLDLSELVQRAAQDHRSQFDAAGVQFSAVRPEQALWVNADAERIAQGLGNLLQNAAKFTGRGGRVTLSLDEDAANRTAIVRVSDTGIGIAPQVLPTLFQPFTQADGSLERSGGGLGLGLALVRTLAELHGGSVDAESAGLGRGATFTLRLPLCTPPAEQDSARQPAPPSAPRRVLIIEDNADGADTLRQLLELRGHTVEVVNDGRRAVETALAFRPEVVLCDIGLPGMDGYEVAGAMRREEALQGVALVALTGYALPDDLRRAAQAGFGRHLAKPPRMEELEEVLATAPPRP